MGTADLPMGEEQAGLSMEEVTAFLQKWQIKDEGDTNTLQERVTRVAYALDNNK